MPADSFSLIAKIVLFILGAASFIVFGLSGAKKYYILYLGFGFCGLGASLFFAIPVFRIIALLITLYSFIISIIEGIKDTKEKLAAFKKEQEDRETAFAEFQAAIIENEKNKKKNNEATVEKSSADIN